MAIAFELSEQPREERVASLFPISLVELLFWVLLALLLTTQLMTSNNQTEKNVGAFMTIILVIGFAIVIATGLTTQNDYTNYDYSQDFAGLYAGFFLGIGGLLVLMLTFSSFAVKTELRSIINLFCVAVSEEFFFRVALARLIYLGLFRTPPTVRLVTAITVSSVCFGVYHAVVYSYSETLIVVAILAGLIQAMAYYFASRKTKMFAFSGIMLGHWLYDLYVVNADLAGPIIFFTIILFGVFLARGASIKDPIEGIREVF